MPVAHSMTTKHRLPGTAVHISRRGAAAHQLIACMQQSAEVCSLVPSGGAIWCTRAARLLVQKLCRLWTSNQWRIHQRSLTSVSLCASALCAMACSTPFSCWGGLLSPILTADAAAPQRGHRWPCLTHEALCTLQHFRFDAGTRT